MPVPKRKTSKSRRDRRHSTRFIRPKAFMLCSSCEYPIVSHQACERCGFYKGIKVIITKLERTIKRTEARKTKQQEQSQGQPQRSEDFKDLEKAENKDGS